PEDLAQWQPVPQRLEGVVQAQTIGHEVDQQQGRDRQQQSGRKQAIVELETAAGEAVVDRIQAGTGHGHKQQGEGRKPSPGSPFLVVVVSAVGHALPVCWWRAVYPVQGSTCPVWLSDRKPSDWCW